MFLDGSIDKSHQFLPKNHKKTSEIIPLNNHAQLSCNGAVSNIPLKLSGNKIFLSRHVSYALSGLYDKAGCNAKNGGYDIYEDPATPVTDRYI